MAGQTGNDGLAGMIAGGIIGCLVLKGYEKKINNNQTKAEITGIIS